MLLNLSFEHDGWAYTASDVAVEKGQGVVDYGAMNLESVGDARLGCVITDETQMLRLLDEALQQALAEADEAASDLPATLPG